MKRLFLTPSTSARERWCEAFETVLVADHGVQLSSADSAAYSSLWLDLSTVDEARSLTLLKSALQAARPVVAMSATPDESQAFSLIKAGAHGYCHVEAAPEQLREIALVVEHGGLWMPPSLMQRFLALSTRVAVKRAPEWQQTEQLTERELMVGERVGQGASNREIAADLGVSERTVKAHLTAIFDKLGVRDRVQLALTMNNIEVPPQRAVQ